MGVVTILGVILLAAALAWGMYQYYTRNRAADPARDAASRAAYTEKGPPGPRPGS